MSKTPVAQTTILVIDDDADLATVFCEGLRLHGFTTLSAATGQAGIQLAQQQPQLIVCDIGLPDINGYEVLKKLRSHPATAAIPVIILTGQETSDTFRPSMEQGADDYLNKPIKISALLQAIQTQLTKRGQLAQHFASVASKSALPQLSTPAPWPKLKEQFDRINQAPWSSLWVIQVQNYSDLYAEYGHVLGQLVLQSIGQQLCQWQVCQWPEFNIEGTLAYLGKDRFVAFLQASKTVAESRYKTAIKALQNDLQQPLVINNHRLIPTIDIQSIPYPHLAVLETLAVPKSDPLVTVNQPSLAERLRRAIQQNELELYFQPQVDLTSGQIVGAEALVRWHIPGESPQLPVQFIPVAEESGLMVSLGEWILETALQQLSQWEKLQRSGISMAVNLSAHQFRSRYFIERLMAMVEAAGVSPIMIDLEFPERLIIDDLGRAKFLLAELQHRGFSTAIDDFSSGSLSHLQYLPVNILKLDKCFVRALHQNRSNQVIVSAIMEMARGLNISTIANGVETARELSILRKLKCQSMQGYLFSPAIKATDFENLLIESRQQVSTFSEERGLRASLQTAINL